MALYTRYGDSGETDLFPWGRIQKTNLRLEALGTLDELNAALGVVRAQNIPHETDQQIESFQKVLLRLSSELSCQDPEMVEWLKRIGPEETAFLEAEIDQLDHELPEIHELIYFQGPPAAAFTQLARAVCRRAERAVWRLKEDQPETPVSEEILRWLNRFSDYLFMLGRKLAVPQ